MPEPLGGRRASPPFEVTFRPASSIGRRVSDEHPHVPGRIERALRALAARQGYALAPLDELNRSEAARKRLRKDHVEQRRRITLLKEKLSAERGELAHLHGQGMDATAAPDRRVPPAATTLTAIIATWHEARASPSTSTAGRLYRKAVKWAFTDGLERALLDTGRPPAASMNRDELASLAAGDRPAFVAAGRALRATGALEPGLAQTLASQLLLLGFPDEALDVLLDEGCAPDPPQFEWIGLLFAAWLRIGDAAQARSALQALAALASTKDQRRRVQLYQGVLELQGREMEPPEWRTTSILISWLLAQRWVTSAARVLAAYLGANPRKSETNEVLEVAFSILRLADRDCALVVLQALSPLYARLGRSAEFRHALAALRGASAARLSGRDPHPTADARLSGCTGEALAIAGDWKGAVGFVADSSRGLGYRRQMQSELARCVGRDVIASTELRFRSGGGRKVFDLFPFNGEFDMLRLKLGEMSGWVDKFVVVEARQTFSGRPKELTFPGRADELGQYADKIIYRPLDAFPPHLSTAWAKEFFQRDSAISALSGHVGAEDIVIVSDVDEILKEELVKSLRFPLSGARMRTFRYFLNLEEVKGREPVKTAILRANLLAHEGCSYWRLAVDQLFRNTCLEGAGWHFSSIGSPSVLGLKMRSYSHTEWAHLDETYFESLLAEIRSNPKFGQFKRVRIDDSFPRYLRSNLDRYRTYALEPTGAD